jgi:hypothetical protein
MEFTTIYKIGSLDEVLSGEFSNNTPETTDVEEAKLVFPRNMGGLITINLIGGYRRGIIRNEVDEIEQLVDSSEEFDILRGLLEAFGMSTPSKINPSLVQIGYDPKIPEKIIKEYIGKEQNRIKIVPYDQLTTENRINGCIKHISNLRNKILDGSLSSIETTEEFERIIKTDKEFYALKGLLADVYEREGLTKKEYKLLEDVRNLVK